MRVRRKGLIDLWRDLSTGAVGSPPELNFHRCPRTGEETPRSCVPTEQFKHLGSHASHILSRSFSGSTGPVAHFRPTDVKVPQAGVPRSAFPWSQGLSGCDRLLCLSPPRFSFFLAFKFGSRGLSHTQLCSGHTPYLALGGSFFPSLSQMGSHCHLLCSSPAPYMETAQITIILDKEVAVFKHHGILSATGIVTGHAINSNLDETGGQHVSK